MKKSLPKTSRESEVKTTQLTGRTALTGQTRVTQMGDRGSTKNSATKSPAASKKEKYEDQDSAFNITLKKESSSLKKTSKELVTSRATNNTLERSPIKSRPPASPPSKKQTTAISSKKETPERIHTTKQSILDLGDPKNVKPAKFNSSFSKSKKSSPTQSSSVKRPSVVLFGEQLDEDDVNLDEAPTIKFKESTVFGLPIKESATAPSKSNYQARRDSLKDQKSKDGEDKATARSIIDSIKEDLQTNGKPAEKPVTAKLSQEKVKSLSPIPERQPIKETSTKLAAHVKKVAVDAEIKKTKQAIAPSVSTLITKPSKDKSEVKIKKEVSPAIGGLIQKAKEEVNKQKTKEALRPAVSKLIQKTGTSKSPSRTIGGVGLTRADSIIPAANTKKQEAPKLTIFDSIPPEKEKLPEPPKKLEKQREQMSIMVSKPQDAVREVKAKSKEKGIKTTRYSPPAQRRTSNSGGIQRSQTSEGPIGKQASSSMPSKESKIVTIDHQLDNMDGIDELHSRNVDSLTPSRSYSMDEVGELLPKVVMNVFESAANLTVPKKSMLPDSRQRLSTMMNTNMNILAINSTTKKSTIPRESVMIPGFATSNKKKSDISFSMMGIPVADTKGMRCSILGGNLAPPELASREGSMMGGGDRHSICSNVSMISNVIDLSVNQAVDVDGDKKKKLNEDPAFDLEGENRGWKNWGVKTFMPTLAQNRIHGMIKTNHFTGYCEQFADRKSEYEKKDLQYSDSLFKPIMASLRGFGGDCSWE